MQIVQQGYCAALYCRISREDENAVESASIETQKIMLSNYAQENGISVFNVYCDDGVSGTTLDRPALKKMLADVTAHKVNCVIVKDLSRLGREYRNSGMLLEDFFPQNLTRFIAIDDGVDMNPLLRDTNTNHLLLVLSNVINEMYPQDISKKTRSALKAKARNGQWVTSTAPYGYIKAADNKNKLIVDDRCAQWVQYIFKCAAQGKSLTYISKCLCEMKAPTPSDIRYNTQLYNWSSSTIGAILKNQVYLGNLVYGRSQTVSYKNKTKIELPPSEWTIVPDTHYPIVSKPDFFQAQQSLRVRKLQRLGNTQHPFFNRLYCPDCGNHLNFCAEPRKSDPGEGYFVCRTNKKFGKGKCSRHYIRLSVLSRVVLHELRILQALAQSNRLILYRQIMDKQEVAQQRLRSPVTERIALTEAQISELDKAFADMYLDKSSGCISEEQYNVLLEHFNNQKQQLKHQMVLDKVYIRKLSRQSRKIDQFIDELIDTDISTLDYSLVNRLISKITVANLNKEFGSPSQYIEIVYKFIGTLGEIDINSLA